MATAATARQAPPSRRARSSSRTARASAKAAVALPAPRRRTAPARRPGGQLIPIAAGAATAIGQLPDSSLMVRMTRGRAWIAVLGVLLVGIVAVNVITLSLSAAAGHIDRNVGALDSENSILRSRDAQRSGSARVRHDAVALGLTAAPSDQIGYVQASHNDVAMAARRLAAASAGY